MAATMATTALLLAMVMGACPQGAGPNSSAMTPYDRHERAVRDFQQLLAQGEESCGGLCQNAVAACEAVPVVCDSDTPKRCTTALRGCTWLRNQIPMRCGACAGKDDDP